MNYNLILSILSIFLIKCNFYWHAFSSEIANDIQEKITLLGKDLPFTHLSLHLSDQEIKTINQIKLNNKQEYNNFNALTHFKSEVSDYLQKLGNNRELSIELSNIIFRMVESILSGFKAEAAWITIRSFTKNSLFDTPRWHTDGYYYSPFSGTQYKVAFTLKGPSTLFYKLPFDLRKSFYEIQAQLSEDSRENRLKMIDLIGSPPLETVATDQGTIFIVGEPNSAAVHSEPSIQSERLFISILPGTKDQIEELDASWHPKNKKQ